MGPGTATITAAVDGAMARADVVVALAPRAAVERLVEGYATALERADLAAAREIFPGMPREVADAFQQLGSFRDLDVTLAVDAFQQSGETATAILRGSYAFDDPNLGQQNIPATVNATFGVGADGRWHITGWDQANRQ